MGELRVQVSWESKGSNQKNTSLHHRLFGRRVKSRGIVFYYDGLLAGFKAGRKVKFADYERFGPRSLSIPADLQEPIKRIFGELNIDHRLILYDTGHNVYRKIYSAPELV